MDQLIKDVNRQLNRVVIMRRDRKLTIQLRSLRSQVRVGGIGNRLLLWVSMLILMG